MAVQQSQPRLWKVINSILGAARWDRDQMLEPECQIANGSHTVWVRLAKNYNDVAAAYALFCDALKREEVETLERMLSNCRGESIWGKMTRYRIFIARTESGEPVGAHAGHVITLGENAESSHAAFIGSYAATAEAFQGMGLMRELFACSLMQAAYDAHGREQVVRLLAGECTDSSEAIWNQAGGRKRIYLRFGSVYRQLRFFQPSLRFNPETGEPTEDAGAVQLSLMVRDLADKDGKEIVPELLRQTVEAIFRWTAKRPRSYFASAEAYAKYQQHFAELLANFNVQLNGEPLCLFRKDERVAKEEDGVRFY